MSNVPFHSSQSRNDTAASNADDDTVVSTSEAARMLGVSNTTIQFMVERGELEAWKTRGGHRRISVASIDRLRQSRSNRADRSRHSGNDSTTLRVLVVEDDEPLRRLYLQTMAQWDLPLQVMAAEDGMQALLMIERSRPDVLITDLNMAPMSGHDFLRRLRKQPEYNSMTIIVVTGVDAAEIEAGGELPRGVVLYGKPVPFEKLQGFLEAMAARKQLSMN
jgi:excisionase family DNA binding protein